MNFIVLLFLERKRDDMIKISKVKLFLWFFTCIVCLVNNHNYAEASNIKAEAEYEIVQGESKDIGENLAFQEAMRNIIEKTHVMVLGSSEVRNSNTSDDVIYAVSSGIVHVIDKKIEWLSDKKVKVSIEVSIDEADVEQYVKKYSSDSNMIAYSKEVKDSYDKLKTEIAELKNELNASKNRYEANQISEKIKNKDIQYLATIWFEKALIQNVNGYTDEALTSLDTAIEMNPEDSSPYALKGNIYSDLKKDELALTEYRKALEIYPENVAVYCDMGLLYKKEKDYKSALCYYNKGIACDPYSAPAYTLRGNLYALLQNKQMAINDFQRAIEINPMYYAATVQLAMVYNDLQKYKLAEEYATKAISLNHASADGYMARGMSLAFQGNFRDAIDDMNLAIRFSKDEVLKNRMIEARKVLLQELRR